MATLCRMKRVVASGREEEGNLHIVGTRGLQSIEMECQLGRRNIFAALRSVDDNARPAPSVITARNCRWAR